MNKQTKVKPNVDQSGGKDNRVRFEIVNLLGKSKSVYFAIEHLMASLNSDKDNVIRKQIIKVLAKDNLAAYLVAEKLEQLNGILLLDPDEGILIDAIDAVSKIAVASYESDKTLSDRERKFWAETEIEALESMTQQPGQQQLIIAEARNTIDFIKDMCDI